MARPREPGGGAGGAAAAAEQGAPRWRSCASSGGGTRLGATADLRGLGA